MTRRIQGKIPHRLLGQLLSRLTLPGPEVIVGPRLGEDAFAVGVAREAIVGSTDPITFASHHIGYYAVNVNANDVATMGARPRWFLATVLFPPGLRSSALRRIFDEMDRACVDLGIRLCGGHTEATSAVREPVVVGAMLGTVPRRKLIRPGRGRPGDKVLLTKRLAIEGTTIIARERRAEVDAILGRRSAARARRLLFNPGISVVKEALIAMEAAPIHAMHDPTEGGLLWGLRELSFTAGVGMVIDLGSLPIYEETRRICRHFHLNPLGLIASGSLLIVVPGRSAGKVTSAIRALGIECTEIGYLKARRLVLMRGGRRVRFPAIKADEISRVV